MRYPKPVPLDEALAGIHSPEAVAARKREAATLAKKLKAESGPGRRSIALDTYARYVFIAGTVAVDVALTPTRLPDVTYSSSDTRPGVQHRIASLTRDAEARADRNMEALVARQIEIDLEAQARSAVYNDPDRSEAERVWQPYANQVQAVAWRQGNKSDAFIKKWREQIDARNEAEEDGYDAAVRRIDARLLSLVGVPHPVLPGAAWEAADMVPASERQQEYDRLEAKYGPRNPKSNGAAKVGRRRLSTRPMSALTETR
jgi:hypothetical protein